MRGSRTRYRMAGPTGSDVAAPFTNDGALASVTSAVQRTTEARPGLVLLAALVIGLAAFAYWTR